MLITINHTKTAINYAKKNMNVHNISVNTFKQLPKLLETPVIIMDSLKPKSIVVFVNAVDNANNPIMCAINIQGVGQYNNIVIDTNLISSVYGKDTNPVGFIQKAVSDNRILYWNKKRSQELSVKTGLQLSNLLTNLDSNVIIRKTNQNVNNNLQKNFKDSQGNTLSKEQEEFFKDSKVRNDKGELEVVYHGTVGEFHTFNKTYFKCRIY